LVESFKLVAKPLDKGARPKSGKLRLNLNGTCFGRKIKQFRPKSGKIEAKPTWHLFWKENQSVQTEKNSAKKRAPDMENQESGFGPRYTPTQGFNLLQISPNWFLGNWTPGPSSKTGLRTLLVKN
jgi:hypothetical protein